MNDRSASARLGSRTSTVKQRVRATSATRPSAAASPASAHPVADKRRAILAAALRLIARTGLHNAPMSALAQEAGVGAGTVYRYFPSKEAMINALYLEVLEDRLRAARGAGALPDDAIDAADGVTNAAADESRVSLWRAWAELARWYLDHPDASNFIQQCRATGILTDETRAAEQRLEAEGLSEFDAMVASGMLRPLSRQVFYALYAGPMIQLVEMRDAGELTVDDAVLRATFEGVSRSVRPPAEQRSR